MRLGKAASPGTPAANHIPLHATSVRPANACDPTSSSCWWPTFGPLIARCCSLATVCPHPHTGFVHRDVRWRNIIYLPAEGRWLLIDLEHAGRVDCDCRRPPFPLQHWSDRILEGDGTYSPASDLRMVAEQLMASQEDGDGRAGALLVRRPPFTLSAAGQDLRRQLLQADSSSREQLAAALLAHPWLQSPAGAGAAGGAGGSAGSPS